MDPTRSKEKMRNKGRGGPPAPARARTHHRTPETNFNTASNLREKGREERERSSLLRMSNGKYKSAEHRATMDIEKTRISWPVFVEPNLDQVVGPLPELISGDDTAPKFKPYAYSDFKFHVRYGLPLD